MNYLLWGVLAVAALILFGSAALAGGSSRFWYGLAKLAASDLAPIIAVLLQPASAEELAKQDAGPGRSIGSRFDKGSGRPFGREKDE